VFHRIQCRLQGRALGDYPGYMPGTYTGPDRRSRRSVNWNAFEPVICTATGVVANYFQIIFMLYEQLFHPLFMRVLCVCVCVGTILIENKICVCVCVW